VVGVKRNFGRFYTLFVMNFRENDFWSQPSKNRCIWGFTSKTRNKEISAITAI